METYIPRDGFRRSQDRHKVIERKLGAVLLSLVSFLALYFWNESRSALVDISNSKIEIREIRVEMNNFNKRLDSSDKLSVEQRQELKDDVAEVKDRVDKIYGILVRRSGR